MRKSESFRLQTSNPPRHPKGKVGKERLDVLIVSRGLARSRERAQALILAGQVRVNAARADKPGTQVATDARIEIIGEGIKYASRGGLKLEGALDDYGLSPSGKICMDVGSSTGGFTDCLLQRGAQKVFAVDVTIDQLDWKLRQDPRVVTIQKNTRYLTPEDVGEPVSFVVVDVSFISVSKILAPLVVAASPKADFLILIKPQFELARRDVGKGGIVREPALHEEAIQRVHSAAREAGLLVLGVKPSAIKRAEGNQEFFLHARRAD